MVPVLYLETKLVRFVFWHLTQRKNKKKKAVFWPSIVSKLEDPKICRKTAKTKILQQKMWQSADLRQGRDWEPWHSAPGSVLQITGSERLLAASQIHDALGASKTISHPHHCPRRPDVGQTSLWKPLFRCWIWKRENFWKFLLWKLLSRRWVPVDTCNTPVSDPDPKRSVFIWAAGSGSIWENCTL